MKVHRKRILNLLLAVLLCISMLPQTAYADELENEYLDEALWSDTASDADSEEFIDSNVPAFGKETCEPLDDPQYTYADAEAENESGNILSPNSILDTNESTDMTLNLDSLNDEAVQTEGNNGNLKKLFARSTIADYVKQTFQLPAHYSVFMQGGCSDGEYLYYGFTIKNRDTQAQVGLFIISCRFDSANNLVIDCIRSDKDNSQLAALDHVNDMTYNNRTSQVVIACGENNKQTICLVNADYLRGNTDYLYMLKRYISCRTSTIAYNATLNQYVVEVTNSQGHFCFLDSRFNLIKNCKSSDNLSGFGRQSLYCDNNYIYSLYGAKNPTDSTIQNVIGIYDWNGNLVKEVNLNFLRQTHGNNFADIYEGENLFMMKDKIYLGMNCFYAKGAARLCYYYCYDLSSEFFHIQYCPDENVQTHLASPNKVTSNVLFDVSTKLLKNSFTKTGYEFTGWTLYNPDTGKWCYANADNTKIWYTEGTQPEGFSKAVYKDKQGVARTVSRGAHVLFCANWKATNKFYVTFNHNTGGSGTMAGKSVVYGTSTTMPKNTFTKSGRTFKGWLIYNSDKSTWLYQNSDGSKTGWYTEGTAPTGYTKKAYKDGTTIAKTVPAGQHVIFYALWNEYIIYYDANGMNVQPEYIKTPTFAVYGSSNTVKKYDKDDTYEKKTLKGYRQHRLELDKWRYENKSDSSDTPWFNKSSVDTNKYKLYLFTGSTVKQTVQIGEHVVFQAQWA